MTGRRVYLIAIFLIATLVCAYDVFMGLRGHNAISWLLAAIMALFALGALRKLIRQDYSSSWW